MVLAEVVSLPKLGDPFFMMIIMGMTRLDNRQSRGDNLNHEFVNFWRVELRKMKLIIGMV